MRQHPDVIRAEDAKNPFAPQIVRTNVASDNPNMIVQGPFFRVSGDKGRVPLDDYFKHGYESIREFSEAADALIDRWHDREGECIEKRQFHGWDAEVFDGSLTILRLRFHDTIGCRPDEAWIPCYLADPIPVPEYAKWQAMTPYEQTMEELVNFLMYGRDKEYEMHHKCELSASHSGNKKIYF